MMIIFAGFLVTRDKMGWLEFMAYLDPINWGLRAMALNEFSLDRYNVAASAGVNVPLGEYLLKSFGLDTNIAYKLGGLGFMAGFLAFVLVLEFFSFSGVRYDRNIGSTRKQAPVVAHNLLALRGQATGKDTP